MSLPDAFTDARRRRFFADATAALTSSLDYNETLQRVADLAVPLLADAFAIHLYDADGALQLVAAAHLDPAHTPEMIMLASGGPRAHESRGWVRAIRESRPILFSEITPEVVVDTLREHPDLVAAYSKLRYTSQISVPLMTRGRTLGGITLALGPGARRYREEDVVELQDLARVAAVAVDNALLFRDVQRRQTDADMAREKADFLSEAGAVLSSSLDYESTIARATQLAVPRLADYCDLRLLEDDGRLKPLSCAHVDPDKEQIMREIARRYTIDLRRAPASAVAIAENRSVISEAFDWRSRMPERDVDDYAAKALEALRPMSAAVIPLSARGRAIGTIALFMSESGRVLSKKDLPVLEEFARRVASAVENARLYESSQESNRLKDEFLSVLSHELRTPLNAVLGWSRMLAAGQLDPTSRQKAIDSIHRNAKAQLRLVEDILDVARGLAGKLHVEPEPVDVDEVVHAAVVEARTAATLKAIEIHHRRASVSVLVSADPVRLRQIFGNLLSNAVKFTQDTGRVEVTVGCVGREAQIRVRDNGIGIDRRFLPHVFERFRQADASVTRGYGGLGLGLAIVRQLIELHGGTVRADSDGHGKGAEFIVSLPVWRMGEGGAEAENAAAALASDDPQDALRSISVLVVDDNEDALEIARTALERQGAAVDTVSSAADAEARIAERRYDALIVDVAMPGEDGCSFVSRLRRRPDAI